VGGRVFLFLKYEDKIKKEINKYLRKAFALPSCRGYRSFLSISKSVNFNKKTLKNH